MEQFDLNSVVLAGRIIRLWGRAGDVYARLRVSNRGVLAEDDDSQSTYVTLRFPQGAVRGKPITLREGELVRVSGYLTQHQIEVSLRRFLDAAGEADFLQSVVSDDLPAWRTITFQRSSNVLNVRALRLLEGAREPTRGEQEADEDDESASNAVNHAVLEGIVARRWNYPRNGSVERFVRLAIYDRFTRTAKAEGRRGLPRRLAHYANVLLPEDERINPQLKQRLRVSGSLRDRGHRVTLHEALLSMGKSEVVELIQRLPDASRVHTISAQWESLHVQAEAVIMYSR